jgi:S-adenosylmethionine:diacylglycerol 3-amino-3-carboxypropyl transferase
MIWYTHVNEDSRPERDLLESTGIQNSVVVCGSGERVIAMMALPALQELAVVDLNPEALWLLQLKLAALATYPPQDYLRFVGFRMELPWRRIRMYGELRENLSEPTRAYWDARLVLVGRGVLIAGHYEQFLEKIRPWLAMMLGKGIAEVLEGKVRMTALLHRMAWSCLKWSFARRWTYRLAGLSDPAFVSPDAAVAVIPEVMDRLVKEGNAGRSFMSHLVLRGRLDGMNPRDLPPSLDEGVLGQVHARLNAGSVNIRFHCMDLATYLELFRGASPGSLFCSASDILSFEDMGYLEKLSRSALRMPGDMLVVRSFLRRRMTLGDIQVVAGREIAVEDHSLEESTGMYQVFALRKTPKENGTPIVHL